MVAPFNSANAFDLSHDHKLTCGMGTLVPVMCEEVAPGDVWRWNADVFLRLMPMLAPIMHDVNVYLHAFNVPSRLLQKDFEKFITGGPEGDDDTSWAYIQAPEGGFAVGSLADYLGLPTGVSNLQVSALPFRAYNMIYNEWYRDQNLIDPVEIDTGNGLDETTGTEIQRRAWHKDYFTGALPWAQRGEPTYLPLGLSAPVITSLTDTVGAGLNYPGLKLRRSDGQDFAVGRNSLVAYQAGGEGQTSAFLQTMNDGASGAAVSNVYPTNLKADLSQATAISINDMRVAFQIQRFMEKNARGGARYIEWLLNHFGVRSSDARLQRPEYLGGGRCPINISEVLQTSSTDGISPQGNMAGRGISYQNVPQFTKTFEEYGYIICMLSIIPKASYQQGVRRLWTRKTRYDYPLPVFAHLGNQEVKNKEIYAQGTSADEGTFGYQERYEELRRIPSSVHGQFRTTLDYWHMGRKFDNLPQLSKEFVECNPTKRVFAVTDENEDSCIVQIHHNINAIRRFPKYGSPGLIDHD